MPDVYDNLLLIANVYLMCVNTSFNLRCPNFIIHLVYCIELDFHSFHLKNKPLHIKDSKDSKMGSISNSLLFDTNIYLRFTRTVILKKISLQI
jgi:hypothetical protein